MVKGLLALVLVALSLAWGWDVGQESALTAHPLWVARQEAMYLSGLLAIGLMSLAMYLATRPAWLETPLGGMDRVYRTHKWAGILGGGFALLHWLLEMSDDILKATVGREGRLPEEKIIGVLHNLQDLAEDFGEWGFYILMGLLAISLWQRFPYRPWRFLHRAMPVIYLLLAFHSALLAPLDYWRQPIGGLLGLLIAAGVYGALRSLLGNIGQAHRSPGQIVAVSQASSDVVVVRCRLTGKWRGHRPGQFALVSFDANEGAHPFTIASADKGNRIIEFRIKALGDHTRQLAHLLQAGQLVEVEGPYGRFDISRINRRARQVWVAGGIGVTPFLAWLGSLQAQGGDAPEADLHYCTRDRDNDPFVDELAELCADLPTVRLFVHGSAQGETLDAAGLIRNMPAGQTKATEVWFCGPSGLADALRRGLAKLGLAKLRFHQEAFVMR